MRQGGPSREALESLLTGSVKPGATYYIGGPPGVGKSSVSIFSACEASRRGRRTLYLTLSGTSRSLEGLIEEVYGCRAGGSLRVLDGSLIREEGPRVAAEKLMDVVTEGGVVYIDPIDLLPVVVGDEKEYQGLTYMLNRVVKLGRGSLVLVSDEENKYERVLSDVVVNAGVVRLDERVFRVYRVEKPSTPSSRCEFLVGFTPEPRVIEPLDTVEDVPSLSLDRELVNDMSGLPKGSVVEVELGVGVPRPLGDRVVYSLTEALRPRGVVATPVLKHGVVKELASGSGPQAATVELGGSVVENPGTQGGSVVRVRVVAGAVVVYSNNPWTRVYYVERGRGGYSLKPFY